MPRKHLTLFILFTVIFLASFILGSRLIYASSEMNIFQRTLKQGFKGPDVKQLQQFLNKNSNMIVATNGPGSAGNETEYFGLATKQAVNKFQNLYRSEILLPLGLTAPTGTIGIQSLKKLNQLISAQVLGINILSNVVSKLPTLTISSSSLESAAPLRPASTLQVISYLATQPSNQSSEVLPSTSLLFSHATSSLTGVEQITVTALSSSSALKLFIDNNLVTTMSSSTLSYNWNTASSSNGFHTIGANAVSLLGTNGPAISSRVSVFNTPFAPVAPGLVTASFSTDGYGLKNIQSLKYNGVEFLNTAIGQTPGLNFASENSNGTLSYVPLVQSTTTWDATLNKRTIVYDKGIFSLQFSTTSANMLNMKVNITNTSTTTYAGFATYLADLNIPYSYAPIYSVGPVAPNATIMTYGSSTVASGTFAFVNSGPQSDTYLTLGSTNRSSSDLQVFFSSYQNYGPSSWVNVHDIPLLPGQTQSYNLSFRFGPAGSGAEELASDAYHNFLDVNPFEFTWADKRPIGRVFPSGSGPASRSATNPRGWFNDSSVDVTSPSGLNNFYNRMIAYATSSAAIMKAENAQGVVVWDIEGEGYPFTYVGDPDSAEVLAPELLYNGVLDKFFKVYTDAGLKVGVTLRPLNAFINASGTPDAIGVDEINLAQDLIQKIQYARNRWGATLFYVDSTNANSLYPTFKIVNEAIPDVLVMPENESFAMYANSAPYNEVRGGFTGVPTDIRYLYPNAFSVITADSNVVTSSSTYQKIVNAVAAGDILMWNGWYPNEDADFIKQVYTDAGKTL